MPQQTDKEVDFSNYFKNQSKNTKPSSNNTPQKRVSRRMVYLIILLLALAAVEAYLLFDSQKKSTIIIPDGYQWVTPGNGPAYIAPIKK
jgi:hypothetical protein